MLADRKNLMDEKSWIDMKKLLLLSLQFIYKEEI